MAATDLLSQDVVPIGAGYLILMGVLAGGLRLLRRDQLRSAGQEAAGPAAAEADRAAGGKRPGALARRVPAGWPRFAVQAASVALGGYLLLMAVDLLYYYGLVKIKGQFIESGFTGGLTLIAIALPLWGLASWLDVRRHRRVAVAQPSRSRDGKRARS